MTTLSDEKLATLQTSLMLLLDGVDDHDTVRAIRGALGYERTRCLFWRLGEYIPARFVFVVAYEDVLERATDMYCAAGDGRNLEVVSGDKAVEFFQNLDYRRIDPDPGGNHWNDIIDDLLGDVMEAGLIRCVTPTSNGDDNV